MELTELVRGAQDAMDRGDYHLAAKACTHALGAYPACMSAHRILGESLLERGETDAAIGHFDRALALDPLSVVARLGLGVAAEERKDSGLAYAHYLHAWEINPALDQVRGQLVRLRAALGSHDRLHPTRAGLAGIHARSGQLGRAASEWRAILAVDPDSTRARTSLAEVLWRAGDDAGAISICREILRVSPDNARALAMLADIEKRVGAPTANELVERYQTVDPMGEVADILSELREGSDLSFLTPSSPPVPDFDFEAAAAESPALPTAVQHPVAAPMAPSLAASHVAAPDLWDTLVRDLQHDTPDSAEAESGNIQPFSWSDDGSVIDLGPAVEPFSLEGLQDLDDVVAAEAALPIASAVDPVADVEPVASPQASGDSQTGPLDLAAIMNPETATAPLAAAVAVASVTEDPFSLSEAAIDQLVAPAPVATPAPVAVAPAPAPAAPPAANPFVTSDGRVDLTIGWDDIDRQLMAATPTEEGVRGYEDLVAELDAGGFAPFAADDGSAMGGAWEPFTADEVDAPVPAVAEVPAIAEPAPVPAFEDEVLGVAPASMPWGDEVDPAAVPADWVDIDDDLIAAIPSPQPSGYTELLRHVDSEEPVQLEDAEALAVDPFATPDTSGDPLGFEDLLTVTSRDGTAELGPVETDLAAIAFALDETLGETAGEPGFDTAAFNWSDVAAPVAVAPEPVVAEAVGLDGISDDLGGIEPFNFDDLVGAGGDASGGVDFSDLEDVFAPVPFAAQAPYAAEEPFAADEPFGMVEPFAVDEPLAVNIPFVADTPAQVAFAAEPVVADEPAMSLADMGTIDWDAAFAVDEAPVAAVAAVHAEETDTEGVIRWPTFIGHTSDLIDRESGGLFGRLRAAKQALVAEGAVIVDRSLAPRAPAALAIVEEVDEVVRQVAARPRLAAIDGEPVAEPRAESSNLDLTAMRVRLIESESAAAEIAETLEAAIAQGDVDPLAMRVLGEAYLRLGRTEQAAAQFRQAMLARRRAR